MEFFLLEGPRKVQSNKIFWDGVMGGRGSVCPRQILREPERTAAVCLCLFKSQDKKFVLYNNSWEGIIFC